MRLSADQSLHIASRFWDFYNLVEAVARKDCRTCRKLSRRLRRVRRKKRVKKEKLRIFKDAEDEKNKAEARERQKEDESARLTADNPVVVESTMAWLARLIGLPSVHLLMFLLSIVMVGSCSRRYHCLSLILSFSSRYGYAAVIMTS